MNITKEVLEKGVVIKQKGRIETVRKTKDGEEFVKFSEEGVKSEIKNSKTETFAQVAVKATLTTFYLLELKESHKKALLGR